MPEVTSRRPLAVVVGASSHIGGALVSRYIKDGYQVVAYTGPGAGVGAGFPPEIEVISLDLSDLAGVQRHLDESSVVRDADVLVLLAADVRPTELVSVTAKELTRALNVGALSGYLFISAVGPLMAARGYGRIVSSSSIGVKFGGGRDSFAYSLSRHAAEFIPREVRDWARRGVLTNVVRIGVTDTPSHDVFPGRNLGERTDLIPVGRAATVDEIVDYLFWHGSASNAYVTGQVLAISGGE